MFFEIIKAEYLDGYRLRLQYKRPATMDKEQVMIH